MTEAKKTTTDDRKATKSTAAEPKSTKPTKAVESSQAEVQASFDEAEAKGHFGERVDPTPLEHYTVEGVLAEKPTPETDAKSAAKAAEATGTPARVVD